MKYVVRALMALVAGSVLVGPAAAQTDGITGRWDVVLNAPDGAHKATLTLKKDGEKVTGTIGNADGEIPVEGTQSGSDLTVSFTYRGGSSPMLITLKGAQKSDSIGGPATFGDAAGDWTGNRAAASNSSSGAATAGPSASASSAVDISGAWLFEVNSALGTGTPTITFDQSGEKLTGQYVGQLGEAPIQGTLKGSELNFTIDVSFQDMKVHIVYSGTATKDALKGTATFGDLGEGTFTARRK
jgi:hypothetical protein